MTATPTPWNDDDQPKAMQLPTFAPIRHPIHLPCYTPALAMDLAAKICRETGARTSASGNVATFDSPQLEFVDGVLRMAAELGYTSPETCSAVYHQAWRDRSA